MTKIVDENNLLSEFMCLSVRRSSVVSLKITTGVKYTEIQNMKLKEELMDICIFTFSLYYLKRKFQTALLFHA